MKWQAHWITPRAAYEKDSAVLFEKTLTLRGKVQRATLYISSLGVYEVRLSGARVGAFIFAPGWTEYIKRIQYQTYDVTALLKKKTLFEIELGTGWMRGRIAQLQPGQKAAPPAVIAELHIDYADAPGEVIVTDETWQTRRSPVLFSDIYDGETCDARFRDHHPQKAKLLSWSRRVLIATEGEEIREQERLCARLIKTPKGETVLDFGQNMTGYIEFRVMAKDGDEVRFDCAEVLDADGNFYRDNDRTAKSTLSYTCREGLNVYKPKFTFFGFRYIRLLKHPGRKVNPADYTAIVVHSDMERTGYLESSSKLLNRLFDNIVWGQKSNYLDVPTDCPQRDERLGWTGDAQVFARTASFNFDVERFFRKWLHDLSATSGDNGAVPDARLSAGRASENAPRPS